MVRSKVVVVDAVDCGRTVPIVLPLTPMGVSTDVRRHTQVDLRLPCLVAFVSQRSQQNRNHRPSASGPLPRPRRWCLVACPSQRLSKTNPTLIDHCRLPAPIMLSALLLNSSSVPIGGPRGCQQLFGSCLQLTSTRNTVFSDTLDTNSSQTSVLHGHSDS